MGSKTKRVPPLDAGWLWLESKSNLMHGCMLAVFTPPEGAGPDYVVDAVEEMRKHDTATAPFDRKLATGALSRAVPRWERVSQIDTSYHLRYTKLDQASERDFGRLVSSIQGTELDASYPLWTIDVIDNLPGGRFAVVGKMHHALVDGVSALGILGQWLSPEAGARDVPPMWAYQRADRKPRTSSEPAPKVGILRTVLGLVRALRLAVTGVSSRPYSAPRSPMNVPITSERRVSTLSLELNRFRKVADRSDATINDVLLAVCSTGLRRYLAESGELPAKPLITNMPVSVRREGASGGNQISWAMLSLATDIDNPVERFDAIKAASLEAKSKLSLMPGGTINAYTLLAVLPILFEQLLRIGGKIKPLFNVPISNVPGPQHELFYNGATLEHVHAMTVLYGGQALNISAVSYADTLEFSFVACDPALPHSQRLSAYCSEALDELEALL